MNVAFQALWQNEHNMLLNQGKHDRLNLTYTIHQ